MTNGIVIALGILGVLLSMSFILSMIIHILITPIIFTPKKVINQIIEAFKVSEKDKIIELGAGDGRLGYALAKGNPSLVSFVEISPLLMLILRVKSWIYKLKKGRSKIRIDAKNIFNVDLSEFDSAYVYLEPKLMQRSLEYLVEPINNGLTVYCYRFPLPQIKPKEVVELANGKELFIYYVQ